jgi:hypothetical protein
MKRLFNSVAAAVGLTSCTPAPPHFTIGTADIAPPAGWTQQSKADERLTLRAPDGRQQATLSVMRFGADPSFDDFKRLCQLRLDAEKKDSPDYFIQSDPPFDLKGKFGMFYSGGNKKAGRVFSGYLSLERRELLVIYLEGLGVDPKEHVEAFQTFVKGTVRK